MIKRALVILAIGAVVIPVLGPFAVVVALGEWIAAWKWPHHLVDALERWAQRRGVWI